jgi:hypothetical protein
VPEIEKRPHAYYFGQKGGGSVEADLSAKMLPVVTMEAREEGKGIR